MLCYFLYLSVHLFPPALAQAPENFNGVGGWMEGPAGLSPEPFQLLQFVEIWIPISEGLASLLAGKKPHLRKRCGKEPGPQGQCQDIMFLPCYSPGVPPTAHVISPGPSAPVSVAPQQGWRPPSPSPALPGLGPWWPGLTSWPALGPSLSPWRYQCPWLGLPQGTLAALFLAWAVGRALAVRHYCLGTLCCSWNTAPGCCWLLLHPHTMSRSPACTFHVADESLKHWGAVKPNLNATGNKSVSQKGKWSNRKRQSLPHAFHMLRNGLGDAEIMSLLGFSDERKILETHKCKKSLESFLQIIIMISLDMMLIFLFLT